MKIQSLFGRMAAMVLPLAFCMVACGGDEPGPSPKPDPDPDPAPAFKQAASQDYQLLHPNTLEAKNVYFLSLINNQTALSSAVKGDAELAALSKKKYEAFVAATTVKDKIAAVVFSNTEITAAGKRIAELWKAGNAWDKVAIDHLSPSGCYILNKSNTVPAFLQGVWATDAQALNTINKIFGDGSQAAHCDDDQRTATDDQVLAALKAVEGKVNAQSPFYLLALECAKVVLNVNGRDTEAINFEPMNSGCNKAAYEAGKKVDWSKYEYTIIMVPGNGPDDYNTPLHPQGKVRCDIGYELWTQGYAPFIMVSGGRIHPSKTKYCEAEEMKKYLMGKGVPEDAIIMEPHARHTPTNVRNMVRVIFHMGLPMNKGGIIACEANVITNTFQSQAFLNRCQSEYSFIPVTFGKTITTQAIAFYPKTDCLNIYSKDPLDP
ncbi:MAG: YdcF family protein [Muribaculaceae bacterium]|nr:YdcF family protein [Muribaculaceae bacterium]